MDIEFYNNLEKSISKERLKHYQVIFQENNEKIIVQKYLLNIELSKALYFPLQKFEITLRNNIHTTLSLELNNNNWFEVDSFLNEKSYEKIQYVIRALEKDKKEITSGRIISELNLGFWCAMFSNYYEQKIWTKYTKTIFPNIPKRYASRKVLMDKINLIRKLRNKVFHFDTIIDIENLFEIHQQILELIYWMNEDMYKLTLEFDEFENIYNNEEKIIEEKLNNLKER